MGKVLSLNSLGALKRQINGKTSVVAGGCFDILHPGHVVFLEKSKALGDFLIVLLESDARIKKIKGEGRPIHTQINRAKVLAALSCVDFIILLPEFKKDSEYDELIERLLPTTISTTKGDTQVLHKKRQAKKVGAKLKFVTSYIKAHSSSKVLKILASEI